MVLRDLPSYPILLLMKFLGKYFPKVAIPFNIDKLKLSNNEAHRDEYMNNSLKLDQATMGSLSWMLHTISPKLIQSSHRLKIPTLIIQGNNDTVVGNGSIEY
mmetsp:Transcript_83592/g.180342  ORF Transcript_83592/g.180342 Transcript_83592/m.180342 type:complete len:102 (-) Transcript_83592:420-725(-)